MKFIEPRIDHNAALRTFERRRLANLWGLLRRRHSTRSNAGSRERRLPFAEPAWLPYYIIPIKVSSSRGESQITVSVEAYSGAFAIFQMHADIVDGEVDGETFPPRLTEEEAARIGQKELLATIMRQRSRGQKPVPGAVISVDVLHYPFWVYYYERRPGFLDIKVLDAATGSKPGGKTRIALIEAFSAASRGT
jgi:hypothetical protein